MITPDQLWSSIILVCLLKSVLTALLCLAFNRKDTVYPQFFRHLWESVLAISCQIECQSFWWEGRCISANSVAKKESKEHRTQKHNHPEQHCRTACASTSVWPCLLLTVAPCISKQRDHMRPSHAAQRRQSSSPKKISDRMWNHKRSGYHNACVSCIICYGLPTSIANINLPLRYDETILQNPQAKKQTSRPKKKRTSAVKTQNAISAMYSFVYHTHTMYVELYAVLWNRNNSFSEWNLRTRLHFTRCASNTIRSDVSKKKKISPLHN